MELPPQEYDLKLNKYYDLALESKVIEETVKTAVVAVVFFIGMNTYIYRGEFIYPILVCVIKWYTREIRE